MSVENSEGESPVQIAECTKHSEVIKLLQEAEETGGKSPTRNTEGVCVCCMYSYVCVCVACTHMYVYIIHVYTCTCMDNVHATCTVCEGVCVCWHVRVILCDL